MIVEETQLKDCYSVSFPTLADDRGSFVRSFDRSAFAKIGLHAPVDHSAEAFNPNGFTLRGMHFQGDPHPDAKLVRCTSGTAFDVVVDLRPGSPSYKKWLRTILKGEESHKAVWVPKGFAHGYLTLSANTTLSYHLFTPFEPDLQRGFRFDDPEIGIEWPSHPKIIGERDRGLPSFSTLVPQLKPIAS